MNLLEMGDAQYIALETFKKSGEGVNTPVWVTKEGTSLFVITQADSWKVKRINNNGRVRVAKSDARGTPESEWVEAQAQELTNAEAVPAQIKRLKGKYGITFRLFSLMSKLRGRDAVQTVIEIQ